MQVWFFGGLLVLIGAMLVVIIALSVYIGTHGSKEATVNVDYTCPASGKYSLQHYI